MIWTAMGWLLASFNLVRLSAALFGLRQDKALAHQIAKRLASRNPYPELLALRAQKERSVTEQQLLAKVLEGLHQGLDLRPSLEALGILLSVDIDQLTRQQQMTKLLFGKAMAIMVSCLGFRLYFLALHHAALPRVSSADLTLCALSAAALIAVLSWWRWQLPQLLSVKLRRKGYRSWLSPQKESAATRRSGLAAEPLAQRIDAELKSYRPLAEAQTRKREELMGLVDLTLGGAIAACTLTAPLMTAFEGFGAL